MDGSVSTEQELLEHARRQTKVLEGIHGVLMFLLAVVISGLLIGLGIVLNGV